MDWLGNLLSGAGGGFLVFWLQNQAHKESEQEKNIAHARVAQLTFHEQYSALKSLCEAPITPDISPRSIPCIDMFSISFLIVPQFGDLAADIKCCESKYYSVIDALNRAIREDPQGNMSQETKNSIEEYLKSYREVDANFFLALKTLFPNELFQKLKFEQSGIQKSDSPDQNLATQE